MKIVMFTNTYWPFVGGLEASVRTFTEDFEQLGHQTLIVTPQFKDAEESTDKVLRVPAMKQVRGTDFSIRLPIPGLIDNAMREFQPDVVHSHHPFMLGDAALRVARQHHIPLVFTHHTLYERYTYHVPFHSEAIDDLAKRLPTEYANLCDTVIAPTGSIARLIEERGVKRPIEIIPTGIDVGRFQRGDAERIRRDYRLPEDATVIGHLGRITTEKNIPYLAESAIAAIQQNPKLVFLLVGEGDQVEGTQKLFAERGLSDHLFTTGKLTGDDVVDAYAAMDIFIFASQTDTQGIVLAEAMASHLPVFALEGTGVSDAVTDGDNGVLLPRNTPAEEFGQKLAALLGDKPRLEAMSERARAAADDYDREGCARQALNVYQTLVAEHAQKQAKELTFWDRLTGRLEAEWELITEKAHVATKTVARKQTEHS